MEIEEIEITLVKPYWRNPRQHKNIEELKKSIQRYGYKVPIVIDNAGHIITGHARYTALKELGYDKVMVVRANDLDAQQVREFRIADNRVAEFSEWDWEQLEYELRDIEELDKLVGFTDEEIQKIMSEIVSEKEGDSAFGITDDDVNTAKEKQSSFVEDRMDGYNDDLVEIHCPFCENSWRVKRKLMLEDDVLE